MGIYIILDYLHGSSVIIWVLTRRETRGSNQKRRSDGRNTGQSNRISGFHNGGKCHEKRNA